MKNGYINLQWLWAVLEEAPLLGRKECEDVALVALLGELHKQKSALDAAIESDKERARSAEAAGDSDWAEYFKGKLVAEIEVASWLDKVIYDERLHGQGQPGREGDNNG